MLDTVHRLLGHLRWADERALRALRGAASPPAQAVSLYAHLLGAEHVWLSRLRGEPASVAIWPELDVEACTALAAENAAALDAFAGGLSETELRRVVSYRNSAGVAFENTVEDILLQVATHGAYHRGQITLLLREGGAEPLATDYIVYVREL